MEDIQGADTDDGVFDAPSPIEMEVYQGGAHDENPAQGDVDHRNVEQTPPTVMIVNIVVSIEVRIYIFYILV
jgi:hypothetical protein